MEEASMARRTRRGKRNPAVLQGSYRGIEKSVLQKYLGICQREMRGSTDEEKATARSVREKRERRYPNIRSVANAWVDEQRFLPRREQLTLNKCWPDGVGVEPRAQSSSPPPSSDPWDDFVRSASAARRRAEERERQERARRGAEARARQAEQQKKRKESQAEQRAKKAEERRKREQQRAREAAARRANWSGKKKAAWEQYQGSFRSVNEFEDWYTAWEEWDAEEEQEKRKKKAEREAAAKAQREEQERARKEKERAQQQAWWESRQEKKKAKEREKEKAERERRKSYRSAPYVGPKKLVRDGKVAVVHFEDGNPWSNEGAYGNWGTHADKKKLKYMLFHPLFVEAVLAGATPQKLEDVFLRLGLEPLDKDHLKAASEHLRVSWVPDGSYFRFRVNYDHNEVGEDLEIFDEGQWLKANPRKRR
jgi:hypothetical protein